MHFHEIRPLRHLPYPDFKRKVITLFKRPDLTQSKLNEFLQSAQERDEPVETFMERLKTLGQLPFRKMGDAERQVMMVSAFCNGLHDREVARLVATQSKNRVADAVRIAAAATTFTSGEKRNTSKPRRDRTYLTVDQNQNCDDNGNNLHDMQFSDGSRDGDGDDSQHEGDDSVVLAGFERKGGRPNSNFNSRRGRTFNPRSNNYPRNQYQNQRQSNNRPQLTPQELAKLQCDRCGGTGHVWRECSLPSNFREGKILESLCRLCQKPGHFAAQCPKSQLPSPNRDSALAKPDATAPPKVDKKKLLTALVAELTDVASQLDEPELSLMLSARATSSQARKPAPAPRPTSQMDSVFDAANDTSDGEPAVRYTIVNKSGPTPDYKCFDGTPLQVPLVHTSDEFLFAHSECSAKRSLFWVNVGLQDRNIWALADSGSCRNLVNSEFYKTLPIKMELFPPGLIAVVAGDGKDLELVGWTIIRLEFGSHSIYHEFGVVPELPVDVLFGGELMKPHSSTLKYSTTGRNTFELGAGVCSICVTNKNYLKNVKSPVISQSFQRGPPVKLSVYGLALMQRISVPSTGYPDAVDRESKDDVRQNKLRTVLSELGIAELPISNANKHKAVALVARCLDAFATDDEDLGHTEISSHEINTGDHPLSERSCDLFPTVADSLSTSSSTTMRDPA